MQLTIDKAGRVVLPKAVRDEYGLEPGAILELEESDDSIVLRPKHDQPQVREKDGLLVISAQASADLSNLVVKSRDDRLDHLAGGIVKRAK